MHCQRGGAETDKRSGKMAQAAAHITTTQRGGNAAHELAKRSPCMTRAAWRDAHQDNGNRRGFGDAYELGLVSCGRRGWNA